MERILVTGGAGFIGSHVVELLLARGHGVTVLDNLDPQVHGDGAREPLNLAAVASHAGLRFLRGDVTLAQDVDVAMEDAVAVVHLAAAVGVGQSMYQPVEYVRANALGTAVVLDAALKARDRVRKLVVASSMSLYGEGAYHCARCGGGEPRERDEAQLARGEWEPRCARCGGELAMRPTPEGKPARIASVYAATKLHQEDLFVSVGRAYRIPTFALRFFNVYGPRQSLNNPYTGVAAIFLSRLLNGRAPLVFEDGGQSRDFVDVRDVARAVVLAAEHTAPEGAHVLNVGTGRATSVRAVAETLAARLGTAVGPELLGKYRAGDVRHCIADASLAKSVLGFEAEHRFEDGLDVLIAWCRSQRPRDAVEASLSELRERGLVR